MSLIAALTAGDGKELATAASIVVSAALAIGAFVRSGRAADRAAATRESELADGVQARYEHERAELLEQTKAMYEREIAWLRQRLADALARVHELEQLLSRRRS